MEAMVGWIFRQIKAESLSRGAVKNLSILLNRLAFCRFMADSQMLNGVLPFIVSRELMMFSDLQDRIRRNIGEDHFVDLRTREDTNSDGLNIVWIDVIYRNIVDGPAPNTMTRIVDLAWEVLATDDVTPIVSFVSIEEDRPLAAAE